MGGQYTVVIADIVGSRQVKDRAALQAKFEALVSELNTVFQDEVAAGFLVTLGDEFQGVLKSPRRCLDLAIHCALALYPVKIRFGIGVGPIDTMPLKEVALGMDGPAFHRAREAVEAARARKLMAVAVTPDPGVDAVLTEAVAVVARIMDGWTPRQRQAVTALRELKMQRLVAERLGVAPAAISQRLDKAMWREIERLIGAVQELMLERFGTSAEPSRAALA